MTASISAIHLLADRPDLAGKWAQLHWREWGDDPGREELSWWVEEAAKAVQRTRVPAAFIAVGAEDEVLGGVGLAQFDLEERQTLLEHGLSFSAERRFSWAGEPGPQQ